MNALYPIIRRLRKPLLSNECVAQSVPESVPDGPSVPECVPQSVPDRPIVPGGPMENQGATGQVAPSSPLVDGEERAGGATRGVVTGAPSPETGGGAEPDKKARRGVARRKDRA
jgi:hypothetical protein